METLTERLSSVRKQISAECSRLGRAEPTLIVVTKNHPQKLVEDLYALGEHDFGENRVQEGLPKAQGFAEFIDARNVNWHLIGQLQTNKVKQALDFASTIHSLDRSSLLEELLKRTSDRVSPLDVFIQVNLTDDASRGGVGSAELGNFADRVADSSTLNLKGLMAVAGLGEEPDHEFERIAKLSEELCRSHPTATGRSIGMSGDFLNALSFGATHLRIGTAITGNRQY